MASKSKPLANSASKLRIEHILRIVNDSFTKMCESHALLSILKDDKIITITDDNIRNHILLHKRLVKEYNEVKQDMEQNLPMKISFNAKHIIR